MGIKRMIGRTNAGMSGTKYSIKNWCATVGLSYNTLSEITEADMRTLMTKYASVAYFLEWYAADSTMITDFIANTKAMKWIGLRDYICDKLMAITDFKTKALASTNWEYILKDHVPIMTSASAPYGTVSAGNTTNDYYPYFAFNQNTSSGRGEWLGNDAKTIGSTDYIQYQFTNPTCVRKMKILNTRANGTYVLRGWNDASNKVDLASGSYAKTEITVDVPNNNYYLYYGLFITATEANFIGLKALQFYGRALNVSVPTMTGNSSPYGEVISHGSPYAASTSTPRSPYQSFDKNTSTGTWLYTTDGSKPYVGYDFKKEINLKFAYIYGNCGSGANIPHTSRFETSLDGNSWTPFGSDIVIDNQGAINIVITNNEGVKCRYVREVVVDGPVVDGNTRTLAFTEMNFFGLDYSERTDRTYLYDHGVEVVPMSTYASGSGVTITKNANDISISDTTTSYWGVAGTTNAIDLTAYSKVRAIVADRYETTVSSGFIISTTRNALTNWSSFANADIIASMLPYGINLDVSSVNEAVRVGLVTSSSNTSASMNFNELWLE